MNLKENFSGIEPRPNMELRKFLGKTDNFKDKEQKHFFQRMLRAYLQGKKVFNYGFSRSLTGLVPNEYKVLQSMGGIGV